MKHVDEYRDAALCRSLLRQIRAVQTRPWTLMEVCGGQTHAIVKHGIDQLLGDRVELIHGPGCPVCVTPVSAIDAAIELAVGRGVIVCTFGDMMRVPGSTDDLMGARARGGDVRAVYSPSDAVRIAMDHPDHEVVFFGVGFETTAPANALAVLQAASADIANFTLLAAHVLVPPALHAVLGDAECRIDGLLAAGHVCTVMGTRAYGPISERYDVPIVVTGFEPVDILDGVLRCVQQLEDGASRVDVQYARAVTEDGNPSARAVIEEVFTVEDQVWRGLGTLPHSGLRIRSRLARFDAWRRFDLTRRLDDVTTECRSGDVLQGKLRPIDCPSFGTACTPDNPLGAPMVSSEGACAAYYRYRASEGRSP